MVDSRPLSAMHRGVAISRSIKDWHEGIVAHYGDINAFNDARTVRIKGSSLSTPHLNSPSSYAICKSNIRGGVTQKPRARAITGNRSSQPVACRRTWCCLHSHLTFRGLR